jgi:predicted DCC family thiol-disulfide oxidoreductase YuxK
MVVIFDGQCVFCSAYVRLLRLRDAVGKVQLLDARADGIADRIVREVGFDLNGGMLVLYEGQSHYGPDAMTLLSLLTSRSGMTNRATAAIFRSRSLARMIYPLLRLGRRIGLAALGRPRISVGRKVSERQREAQRESSAQSEPWRS